MSEGALRVRVSDKYSIADQTVAIELVAEDGGPLPAFTAGAYIDVDLGYGMVRQYSLANSPAEQHRYLLGVLKAPNSQGISAALHDVVLPGNGLQISTPKNLFPLDEAAGYSVLVGGGIGITPMLSFAHRLHSLGRPFELHFCARDPEHAPFYPQLADLPFYEQITLHFDNIPDSALELSQQQLSACDNTHLYVCGPKGFMTSVLEAASPFLADAQIHQESFDPLPAPPPPTAHSNHAFEVELRSSGAIIRVEAQQSLVEALQQHGVAISRGCPRAFCGSCAVTVLEGAVDHRDSVLPDQARHELGKMLSCVSRAQGQRLVLDL